MRGSWYLIRRFSLTGNRKATTMIAARLKCDFREFAENFDYTIFTYKTALEAIDDHRNTPYFAARFGGGLLRNR